jgi:myo-inositol 2-dehydrogenase/D-chiro-inositol 1-dehydrogenase
VTDQLRRSLIGTDWIGRFHARTLATRSPNTALVAVAELNIEAAQSMKAPKA